MATNSLYKLGYRRLLRSAQVAFQGDTQAVTMARLKLRESFYENRQVKDAATLQQLAKDVDDVDEMLRFHIVQGVKGNEGKFEVKFNEEHTTAIAAEQDSPHGPELEPIDRGYIGRDVKINHSTSNKKKTTADNSKSSSCGSSTCTTDHKHNH